VAQVTRYDEIDLFDDHWSTTEIGIGVVFVVLGIYAVWQLLRKKKQHE
jgi:hypothetical protein